jgi:hypothetical protein
MNPKVRTSHSTRSPFLDLPAELRLRIYEHLYPAHLHARLAIGREPTLARFGHIIKDKNLITFGSRPSPQIRYDQDPKYRFPITPLHLTCRILHAEALPVVYDRTVFHIFIYGVYLGVNPEASSRR